MTFEAKILIKQNEEFFFNEDKIIELVDYEFKSIGNKPPHIIEITWSTFVVHIGIAGAAIGFISVQDNDGCMNNLATYSKQNVDRTRWYSYCDDPAEISLKNEVSLNVIMSVLKSLLFKKVWPATISSIIM